MKPGTMILIEGLDLAGKSLLVANLQRELLQDGVPVRVSRNSLCPDNPVARLADSLRRDPAAGFVETGALFLAAHCWDARHFEPPREGEVHLQDSSWLRTLAFHTHHQTPGIPEQLREASRDFPKFNRIIFLTANIEERQRRLRQRDREVPSTNDWQDHLVLRDPNRFLLLEDRLRQICAELGILSEVDTSEVRPEDVSILAMESILLTSFVNLEPPVLMLEK